MLTQKSIMIKYFITSRSHLNLILKGLYILRQSDEGVVIAWSTGSQSEGVARLTVSISVFFVVWQISSEIISISTSCKMFGRDPSAIRPQPAIQQTVPKISGWLLVRYGPYFMDPRLTGL